MTRNIEDRMFDLLVDDELSEDQRRELLARLDDTPDGWRRCAMSFLEAQSWRRELGALVPDATSAESQSRSLPPRRPKRVWTALAMAASFLVALWLGTLLKDALRSGGPLPTQIADAPQESPAPPVRPDSHPDSPAAPWQTVTLAVDGGPDGEPRSIELPAVERSNLADAGLEDLPAAIPPEILKALRSTGHQVRQSRQLLPVPLRDGRRLVVPVDQFDVNYVGNRAYQ